MPMLKGKMRDGGRCLRRAWVLLLPLLVSSCLTGGGRFQKKMGEGPPLYDEPVFKWQASDKAVLPYCRWLPPKGMTRKGIVIAIPGMDEASVDWTRLGRYVAARGYEMYSPDLRGQGKDLDARERGNYHRWRRWVEDVNEFAAQARGGRKLPVAYMGHSLGGMVALAAAERAGESAAAAAPDALVLYAPAFVLAYPRWFGARAAATTVQVMTLNLARVTGPAVFELMHRNIVSNPEDEAAWERSSDRLCGGMSFRYVGACLAVGKEARDVPGKTATPVLLQYGRSDTTIPMCKRSPERVREMFQARDTELWWHPNPKAAHDMLNDRLVRQEMLAKTYAWLDERLGAASKMRTGGEGARN